MRNRLIFALLGALACGLAALMMEPVFRFLSVHRAIDDHETHVLIYRSDIGRRLEQAGAQHGEVEVSLDWSNRNDLDLHVFDPHGFEVFYGQKQSREGGNLDVDANMAPPFTRTPVEHIVWPYGRAPIGRYMVVVKHYRNHGDPDPTRYHVEVREHGRVTEYSGSIDPEEQRTVCEFYVGRSAGAFLVFFWPLVRAAIITGAWGLLLSTLLAAVLIGGQQWLYRRRYREWLTPPRRVPGIVVGGSQAGLVAGVFGQLLFSGLEAMGTPMRMALQQGFGWALLGAVMGAGIARRMPNLPRFSALIAGLLGGVFGCYCYVTTLQTGSDLVGRVTAAAGIGFLIGLMIRLVIEPPEEPEEYEPIEVSLHPMQLRASRGRAVGAMRPPGPS
jgi:hypothetical protein